MVYRYDCNGFFNQIRLGSYQLAQPVPGILTLCNYLQNVGAKTYIFGLQLSTFLFYNKQVGKLSNFVTFTLDDPKIPMLQWHATGGIRGMKIPHNT